MPIYRLLQQSAFSPEDIDRMVTAYEDCLRELRLTDRSEPLAEILAKKIIEFAQTGERDPSRLRKRVFEDLAIPTSEVNSGT